MRTHLPTYYCTAQETLAIHESIAQVSIPLNIHYHFVLAPQLKPSSLLRPCLGFQGLSVAGHQLRTNGGRMPIEKTPVSFSSRLDQSPEVPHHYDTLKI
ncbi:hypothetical protein I7I50_03584 [Histoplasma capsulatum G186AR]|uniref:Uncharacterized protein n=1 Tax=Ajellomyces capsulatus TaxID=5037 RepID=A0A8H7YKP2_AJECA|nr:hypothetical protein I7I52_04491 [Histoplasma capsulatum]QSS74692.1 hypothetical protein I7I50_03584 [Histoplasma capsulatum G186AR]